MSTSNTDYSIEQETHSELDGVEQLRCSIANALHSRKNYVGTVGIRITTCSYESIYSYVKSMSVSELFYAATGGKYGDYKKADSRRTLMRLGVYEVMHDIGASIESDEQPTDDVDGDARLLAHMWECLNNKICEINANMEEIQLVTSSMYSRKLKDVEQTRNYAYSLVHDLNAYNAIDYVLDGVPPEDLLA